MASVIEGYLRRIREATSHRPGIYAYRGQSRAESLSPAARIVQKAQQIAPGRRASSAAGSRINHRTVDRKPGFSQKGLRLE